MKAVEANMIDKNSPVFGQSEEEKGALRNNDSSEVPEDNAVDEEVVEQESEVESGPDFSDCVFAKSGMLTMKLASGDEISVIPIEDEWPSDAMVEGVESDGDVHFVSFDSTDVQIQLLQRHIVQESTTVTIPQ